MGYLQVSDLGRVKSLARKVKRFGGKGDLNLSERIMKASQRKDGYLNLRACLNGVKTSLRLHRLVAKAFIPNPLGLPEVNHIDGNKSNNRVTNLEWVTGSENVRHSIDTGLTNFKTGKLARSLKRSVGVYKNGSYVTTLSGNKEIVEFGLCYKAVSRCLLGQSKRHKGYKFKVINLGEVQ